MKTVTTHEAKTQLSRLIRDVQAGETVIILNGKAPVAKLTAYDEPARRRPRVGAVTSDTVSYTDETFAPMNETELEDWGV